jgi:hypothetical protein
MVSDLDIYRAANLLIRQHGAEAAIEAARKADLMLDRGDTEGRGVWLRIKRAIVELQAPQTGAGALSPNGARPPSRDGNPRGPIGRRKRSVQAGQRPVRSRQGGGYRGGSHL